jgi:hypothetical protein
MSVFANNRLDENPPYLSIRAALPHSHEAVRAFAEVHRLRRHQNLHAPIETKMFAKLRR